MEWNAPDVFQCDLKVWFEIFFIGNIFQKSKYWVWTENLPLNYPETVAKHSSCNNKNPPNYFSLLWRQFHEPQVRNGKWQWKLIVRSHHSSSSSHFPLPQAPKVVKVARNGKLNNVKSIFSVKLRGMTLFASTTHSRRQCQCSQENGKGRNWVASGEKGVSMQAVIVVFFFCFVPEGLP